MTIDRPTRAYLYGTMCDKCLELLQQLVANSSSVGSLSVSKCELDMAQQRRHARLQLVVMTARARQLAFAAIDDGEDD